MYTYTQSDRDILPSKDALAHYLNKRPFAHLFDIMREFFELDPMILEDSTHFAEFSQFLESYLEELIKSSLLTRKGKYYLLLKNKDYEVDVPVPTSEDIITTFAKINCPVDSVELAIDYFDGCDAVKLENLCHKLVDRGILTKIGHDNFYLVKD